MRLVLKLLIFLPLIISGCEKEDEIVPVVLPSVSPPPPSIKPGIQEQVKSTWDFNSQEYQYGTFKGMPYRVLVPRNYDPSKKYPLHIFLHGISERGTDNEQQLSLGASQFHVDSVRDKYPAFIIFPQCPNAQYWFHDPVMTSLKGLIDAFVADNTVDKAKISIAGFSMGAYGTFAMVAKQPGFFEAAIAIAGDGDERKASLMAKTSWQIFAGEDDEVVASSKTEQMATALLKSGASVTFTLFPEADHRETWRKAFSKPDFFSLLFSSDKNTTSP